MVQGAVVHADLDVGCVQARGKGISCEPCAEIERNFAAGSPGNNIPFQTPRRAVLS